MKRSVAILLAILATVACLGCTTLSLKRQTISHAESAADLRYREVLENLAMIYENPATMPAYCSIYFGTTDVTDTIPLSPSFSWLRTIPKIGGAFTSFAGASLDVATSRAIKKNWSLDPAIVPEKLYAMRCACWWVLFGPDNQFGDSLTLAKYDPKGKYPAGAYFNVADQLANLPPNWLHKGCRREAPLRCCLKAYCGDKCAWVENDGVQGLSDFTLVLQKIARAAYDSILFPTTSTETVVLAPQGMGATDMGPHYEVKVTVFVDPEGYATPGTNIPSLPRRARLDNVGSGSDLKSSISAATKNP